MLQWAVATNLSWLPLMWGAVLHGHWGWLSRSFKLRFLSLKPQKSVCSTQKPGKNDVMQQPIWSGRRSLGSIWDIYHQLQTFFKLNLYALSLFCTTGEDWEAWVKLVLREFVVEDMSGCNGMWLLGENWVVRDFEVFGSVETREWADEIFWDISDFLVQNILGGLSDQFSGMLMWERAS